MNPAAANSGAQTESITARSGARPSATACVSTWWSDWRGTLTTLIWLCGPAASRTIRAHGPSVGTMTRTSGWSGRRLIQCGLTKDPRRRWRRITPSSASSESARLTGVRLSL